MKARLTCLALVAAASVATIPSAFAQSDSGFYVGGSVGYTDFGTGGKNDIDSALVSAGVTNLSSSLTSHDTGYKIFGGYQFTPNIAVEGGYVWLGTQKYRATYTGGTASVDAKGEGFNIDVLGILPLGDSFSLFAKVGAIDAKMSGSVTATGPGGTAAVNVSQTQWKANYGIGATYNFAPALGLRAEIERFDFPSSSSANLYSVGVQYKF